jgi:hypothetical protein
MMELNPKFVIETDPEIGDCLVIGKCNYHIELVNDEEKTKGGGWWKKEGNKFFLFGSSDRLGKAEVSDIKYCIERGNVFTNKYMINSIVDKFEFYYFERGENIDLKK